jgi:hypothetical protein
LVNEITDLNLGKGRVGIASQYADWEVARFDVETRSFAKPGGEPTPEKGKQ